jgi:hypothetical protein
MMVPYHRIITSVTLWFKVTTTEYTNSASLNKQAATWYFSEPVISTLRPQIYFRRAQLKNNLGAELNVTTGGTHSYQCALEGSHSHPSIHTKHKYTAKSMLNNRSINWSFVTMNKTATRVPSSNNTALSQQQLVCCNMLGTCCRCSLSHTHTHTHTSFELHH